MKLRGINRLWVADITYIRLKREFVYLAVEPDAFSRRVVCWQLDKRMAEQLPLAALHQALAERKPGPGLVQHSDLGHMRVIIEEFIELYYNQQRLHSALGYQSPVEFEQRNPSVAVDSRSATMVFFENNVNEQGASSELSGEGDSVAVPIPGLNPCWEIQRHQNKFRNCAQSFCDSLGGHLKS